MSDTTEVHDYPNDGDTTAHGAADHGGDAPHEHDEHAEAPKSGLFNQIGDILGKGGVEAAKIGAITLAAEGYAANNQRAIKLLDALDAEAQMDLVQKGVTGVSLSTVEKIMLFINPGIVLLPAALEAAWNGFKRNTITKLIPDAWINDISWLSSQAEVVAMFSTGVVHAKNPETATTADEVLVNFLKNTSTAARLVEVGADLVVQPEIAEGAQVVRRGAEIANQAVAVFPKVRENMESKRTEVATTQVVEHDKVAKADREAHIEPANNTDHHQEGDQEAA